jgi:predicted phage tail protein
MKKLISDYMTMILFVLGAVFINIGTYFLSWIGGLFATGITFIIFAIIRNNEERS